MVVLQQCFSVPLSSKDHLNFLKKTPPGHHMQLCHNSLNLRPNKHLAKLCLSACSCLVCSHTREVVCIYTVPVCCSQAPSSTICWPTPPCCLGDREMTELSHRDSTSQGSK